MNLRPSIRRRRLGVAAIAVAASLMFVAGCGSSGSQSASGTTSGGVDQSGLAQAKALVAKVTQRPTRIPNSTPIDKPIPQGKNIVFLSAGTTTSNLEYAIIKQATDKLGWNLSEIANDGTPEKTKAAWDQIVRQKPDGVIYSATPRAYFNSELLQAQSEGIKVAACCTTDPAENGLDYVISTPSQSKLAFQSLAAWVIAHSQGKANSVFVGLPSIPILQTVKGAFMDTMNKWCPKTCTTGSLDLPMSALGRDVPTRIVAYLRAHPSVKTVVLAIDGSMGPGLPAALKAAGLNDITVIGDGPTPTTLQYISSGQQAATVTFPYYEEMFSCVDALAREFAGVPLEPESSIYMPQWIVTKDTLPTDQQLFPLVANNNEQYFKLWGLS